MTLEFNTNADIIGRENINDIEAILAMPGTDPDEIEHVVKDNADDAKKIRRYIEHKAAKRKGDHWQQFHAARHLLPS